MPSKQVNGAVVGDIAVEAFTCLLIFKNVFSFGLTFKAYPWLVEAGSEKIFKIVGSVQLVICLLSIPMCKTFSSQVTGAETDLVDADILGKKNRAFFHKHDILKILHLR